MENKKVLNYGDKIEVEKMEKVAMMIAKKSLKVMNASGSIYARNILEHNTDEIDDIRQEIILKIIENNYIYSKALYNVARHYIYWNYEKTQIELVFEGLEDDDAMEDFLNKKAFLSFIEEGKETEKTENPITISDFELTNRQKEILKTYCKTMNQKETGRILGISQQAVGDALKSIRDNAFFIKMYLIKQGKVIA